MKKLFIIIFAANFFLLSCKKDDDIYTPGTSKGVDVSSILQLDAKGATDIPADQATPVTIYVTMRADAAAASKTITLATTVGIFGNSQATSSVTADANGKAEFTLTSANIGTAIVTATSGAYSVTTSVKFVAAMPDDLILTADKYQVSPSETATMTATLYRAPQSGSVTDPVKVEFSVSGGSGQPLFIPAFAYSTHGVATAVLGNPFGSVGTYTVTATSTNQQGQPISKSITVVIK
jgi:hypothetical protein